LKELKQVVTDIHYLNVSEIMNKRLKKRIKLSKIIYKTLGTVTTAPKDIRVTG
jgi:hypothetical protein